MGWGFRSTHLGLGVGAGEADAARLPAPRLTDRCPRQNQTWLHIQHHRSVPILLPVAAMHVRDAASPRPVNAGKALWFVFIMTELNICVPFRIWSLTEAQSEAMR